MPTRHLHKAIENLGLAAQPWADMQAYFLGLGQENSNGNPARRLHPTAGRFNVDGNRFIFEGAISTANMAFGKVKPPLAAALGVGVNDISHNSSTVGPDTVTDYADAGGEVLRVILLAKANGTTEASREAAQAYLALDATWEQE